MSAPIIIGLGIGGAVWWLACRAPHRVDATAQANAQTTVGDLLDKQQDANGAGYGAPGATEPITPIAGSPGFNPGLPVQTQTADGLPTVAVDNAAPLSTADASTATAEFKDAPGTGASGDGFVAAVYGAVPTVKLTRLQLKELYADASAIGDDVPL